MEKLLLDYCRELNKDKCDSAQKKRADIYMDILLSLLNIIDEGSNTLPISPGAVVLDDDNQVHLKNERVEGLLYNAPETVFEGADNSSSAQLFSLGLIIFYMIYGRDFYSFFKLNMLDIEAIKAKIPTSLIRIKGKSNRVFPEGYYQRLLEVMKGLTAWDPAKRESGKVKLIEMYSNIISDNKVFLVDGDTRIGFVRCKTQEDIKGFPQKNDMLTIKGSTYELLEKIDIPYRPGEHNYTIRVRKIR